MKGMKQESRIAESVNLVAFALTLVAFALTWVGIGLFFLQYLPAPYLGYLFIILGIVLFVFGSVFYYRKIETPLTKRNKPENR